MGIAISLVSGLDIGNFKHMQNVNKIKMVECKAPTEKDMRTRLRERLQVKVEHEMRNQAKEHEFQIERLIPIVEEMAETQQGRRDLAGVAAAYLAEHRPETTISEPAFIGDGDDERERSGDGGRRGGSKRRGRSGGRSRGGGGRRDRRRSPCFSRRPDRT